MTLLRTLLARLAVLAVLAATSACTTAAPATTDGGGDALAALCTRVFSRLNTTCGTSIDGLCASTASSVTMRGCGAQASAYWACLDAVATPACDGTHLSLSGPCATQYQAVLDACP